MARPGFLFCVCPDSVLLKRHVEQRLAEHPAPPEAGGEWERLTFWAEDGLTDPFWEALTVPGLIPKPRAILLRQAQSLKTEDWSNISKTLGRANSMAWPFLCLEGPWERGKPKLLQALTKQKCWGFAEKKQWVWQSAGLNQAAVKRWVQDWAAASGLALAPGALEALCAVLPPEAGVLESELEKIRLLAADGRVTAEAAQIIQQSLDMDAFELIKALQRGDSPGTVWGKLLSPSGSGGSADLLFPLLGLLQREARVLWRLNAGEQVKLPPSIVGMKTNMARRLGAERLGRMMDLHFEAELGVKSGRRSPDQALEALVAGLSRLFGQA